MPGIESRDFAPSDETKSMVKTTIELVGLAGGQIQRTTFQPGFRWSESIGPVMGASLPGRTHRLRGFGAAARRARRRKHWRGEGRRGLPDRAGP